MCVTNTYCTCISTSGGVITNFNMKCVALFMLIGTVAVMAQDPGPDQDPCNMAYTLVDEGWRSINCKLRYWGCDRYMSDGWYRVQEKNSQNFLQMPTSCVPPGGCGVSYPIWLNGSHPSIQDGVVNSTACARSFRNCCHHSYPVRIKNCSNYMVYYLEKAHGCMERYCFGESATCNTTDSINGSDSNTTGATIHETTVTERTTRRTTPSLVTTLSSNDTSSFPQTVPGIETTRHMTQAGESPSTSTTLNATARRGTRNMDTTPNIVEPFSDAESVTAVVLNSDQSLAGITTTIHTPQNAAAKGQQVEALQERDPELLIVIAVLSTLLVVLTAAVVIFIITKMRARNLYGIPIRKESNANKLDVEGLILME